MTYASVAAQHLPPGQPQPDPGYLEGQPAEGAASANATNTDRPDVDHKLNVVPSDWHGETEFRKDLDAQAAHLKDVAAADASSASQKAKSALSSAEKEAKKLGSDASAEAKKLSRKGKKELERPEVQLGLIGVVNAVVIVGVGYAAWRNWDQRRWDRRVVSATVIGLGALFGSQGYFGWLFYGKDKK